jgi:hypothetical protein
MDFVFNCASCHGPLIARSDLRGLRVQCAHCFRATEIRSGRPVTESLVNDFLEAPKTAATERWVLRRVRPAIRHSSAPASRARPLVARGVRISHAV